MIQFQFNGRRGLANDLIVGIADGKAAIGQEGEAVWVVKFWLAVNAVGGAGFTGESSHGGDSSVGGYFSNRVVEGVCDIKIVVCVKAQFRRLGESRSAPLATYESIDERSASPSTD